MFREMNDNEMNVDAKGLSGKDSSCEALEDCKKERNGQLSAHRSKRIKWEDEREQLPATRRKKTKGQRRGSKFYKSAQRASPPRDTRHHASEGV